MEALKDKAGFTGTQQGMTEAQREACQGLLVSLGIKELHHGDCIGADVDMHKLALEKELFVVIHPPEDPKKRAFCRGDVNLLEKPYLERNHDIIDVCDLLIATPKEEDEQLRSGTWATVRYARKQKKSIYIVFPSGSVKRELFS